MDGQHAAVDHTALVINGVHVGGQCDDRIPECAEHTLENGLQSRELVGEPREIRINQTRAKPAAYLVLQTINLVTRTGNPPKRTRSHPTPAHGGSVALVRY